MPGLIESHPYTESKAKLHEAVERIEDAFDAAEWKLLQSVSIDGFDRVAVSEDHLAAAKEKGVEVRSMRIEGTPFTPGLVVVFTSELFEGSEKILLLDAWQPEDEEDDQ